MSKSTVTGRKQLGETLRRTAVLCLLVLAALWCQVTDARAQWTTTGTATTTTTNVGIGTSNTTYGKLQVNKSIRIDDDSGSVSGSDTLTNAPFMYIGTTAGGSALQYNAGGGLDLWQYNNGWGRTVTFAKNGNVGVGTSEPLSQFHLHGSSPVLMRVSGTATDQHLLISFHDNNSSVSKGFVGYLGANGTGARYMGIINNSGDYLGLGTINATPVYFFIGGAPTHIMAANGNVGIGTTAPTSRLHVVGDITVTGNINAKYQDVAEWVPSTQKLSAGTVVVLDAQHANHVNASTKPYDTGVAGVVSAQPGLTLGEAGEGKALVATTGRVKVKVDATRAAIHIGDLIVTSDVAGVGMKSEPVVVSGITMHRPGTIIGKALESLEQGKGEILVLLSLQ